MPIQFEQWLKHHFGSKDYSFFPLTGDASFRLYYRVYSEGNTWVAMDASAEKEKCPQFITIADALRKKGLHTPEIFAQDLNEGFLLLTDMGDDLFLKKLNSQNVESFYALATDSLAILSQCENNHLPIFTLQFMREELNWFQEWFLEKHLKLNLSLQMRHELNLCFDLIAAQCAMQPYVFMHRDYHSANLIVLSNNEVGILDFQDAFKGPLTYDLVSLLRDCYIDWPNELIEKIALAYRDKLLVKVSDAEFLQWFDWMGVQRHLKALMTFSRKFQRDHASHYLQFIPRTLHYILQVTSKYSDLHVLNHFLNNQVKEKIACVP